MASRRHSVELKLLHGVEQRELAVTTVKAARREPKAPSTLSPATRKVWNHVTAELRDMGQLAAADLYEIVAYCEAVTFADQLHSQIMSSKSLVTTTPNGVVHAHPLIASYNATMARCHALAKTLGLNPYARTLIYGQRPDKSDTEAAHTPDLYSA